MRHTAVAVRKPKASPKADKVKPLIFSVLKFISENYPVTKKEIESFVWTKCDEKATHQCVSFATMATCRKGMSISTSDPFDGPVVRTNGVFTLRDPASFRLSDYEDAMVLGAGVDVPSVTPFSTSDTIEQAIRAIGRQIAIIETVGSEGVGCMKEAILPLVYGQFIGTDAEPLAQVVLDCALLEMTTNSVKYREHAFPVLIVSDEGLYRCNPLFKAVDESIAALPKD